MHVQKQARWLVTDPEWYRSLVERIAETAGQTLSITDWIIHRTPGSPQDYLRFRRTALASDPRVNTTEMAVKDGDTSAGRRITKLTLEYPDDFLAALGDPNLRKKRYCLLAEDAEHEGMGSVTIDEYASIPGLVIVECNDPPERPLDGLPDWLRGPSLVDVTTTLTSAHLANLPRPGRVSDELEWIRHFVIPGVRKIPITGGPGAGKSTLLVELEQRPDVEIAREMATVMMHALGINPMGADGHGDQFQLAIRDFQLRSEALICAQAKHKGKRVVALDRGVRDNFCYVGGTESSYLNLYGVGARNDLNGYHAVVHLAAPPREVYERVRGNNPARRETYEEAVELDRLIQLAWKDHPRYVRIDADSWDKKRQLALEAFDRFAAGDFVQP